VFGDELMRRNLEIALERYRPRPSAWAGGIGELEVLIELSKHAGVKP
jgi:hypothetical protein